MQDAEYGDGRDQALSVFLLAIGFIIFVVCIIYWLYKCIKKIKDRKSEKSKVQELQESRDAINLNSVRRPAPSSRPLRAEQEDIIIQNPRNQYQLDLHVANINRLYRSQFQQDFYEGHQ